MWRACCIALIMQLLGFVWGEAHCKECKLLMQMVLVWFPVTAAREMDFQKTPA